MVAKTQGMESTGDIVLGTRIFLGSIPLPSSSRDDHAAERKVTATTDAEPHPVRILGMRDAP